MDTHKKIALVGNPNSGKSSLFNLLTGMSQHVGNFPGVTVDKKEGRLKLPSGKSTRIVDLPGLYSMYPNSSDERLVVKILSDPKNENYPDRVIYVADVMHLERHLLLLTQIIDLEIPCILALNMMDLAESKEIQVNTAKLSSDLNIPVVPISSKKGSNIDQLLEELDKTIANGNSVKVPGFYQLSDTEAAIASKVSQITSEQNAYRSKVLAHHHEWLDIVSDDQRQKISEELEGIVFENLKWQVDETLNRYKKIDRVISRTVKAPPAQDLSFSDKVDQILTHKVFGPIIFFIIMLLVFQAIFAWAEFPMTWIESGMAWVSGIVSDLIPDGWFRSLLVDGVLAGIGGIVVFVPQIAILFFLISLLEESGYMSRAMFMFDGLMQKFGLNGRSIVALISGGACAIPAIMSTRTISNWKERLITILVTPFISCSARIPVYTVLVAFVVPPVMVGGVFSAQALVFMGLYLLGIFAALAAAWIFNMILKSSDPSYLLIELPSYRIPLIRNVLMLVKEKVLTFIIEAGKIIFLISIVLWILASHGPGNKMELAESGAVETAIQQNLSDIERDNLISSRKLEASFAGELGKFIEPVIRPLGYDWKMGIALITSFAAREVFIGTMATIYSIGSSNDELTIRQQMAQEVNPETGRPVYNMASSLSLLLFYVFAMQCMSTLAVTKRETKSWKWPIIQFSFMTGLAYLVSLLCYQLLT